MKSFVYLLVALGLASCSDPQKITGTWQFIADQQLDDQGKVVLEDKDVDGMLIYTNEGDVSVNVLLRGRRQPIMSDSIMQYDGVSSGLGFGDNTWTSEQRQKIIDTYDAYFGSYSVDPDQGIVTHVVEGNLRPEKTPVEFKRKFVLKGDTLLLRSLNPEFHWQAMWLRKN